MLQQKENIFFLHLEVVKTVCPQPATAERSWNMNIIEILPDKNGKHLHFPTVLYKIFQIIMQYYVLFYCFCFFCFVEGGGVG